MERLEVSGAVRLIYRSLGVKGLRLSCNMAKRHGGTLKRSEPTAKVRGGEERPLKYYIKERQNVTSPCHECMQGEKRNSSTHS